DTLAGFEDPVTAAVPAVGGAAVIGRPRRPVEPHAILPDTTGSLGAEDVVGEHDLRGAEAAHRRWITGAAVPGIEVLGVDGETTTGDQVIADRDIARVPQRVPDRDGTVRVGGHLVCVVLDEAAAGAFGLVAILVTVRGCGGEVVEIAVPDDKIVAGGTGTAVRPAEDAVVNPVAIHRIDHQAGALMPDARVHTIIAIDRHLVDGRAGADTDRDAGGAIGILTCLAAVGGDTAVLYGDIPGFDVDHARDVLAADHGVGSGDHDGPAEAASVRREPSARALRQVWTGVGGAGPAAARQSVPERRTACVAVGGQRPGLSRAGRRARCRRRHRRSRGRGDHATRGRPVQGRLARGGGA